MENPCPPPAQNAFAAKIIEIHSPAELADILPKLGFQNRYPTLVLVGGAGGINETDMCRLQQLFIEVLAPTLQTLGVAVVDGGTDAGIMRLMGQTRNQLRATFPLIGVAAIGTVQLPHFPPINPDAAPLEPNHSHIVLVPGAQWGDESPWIAAVANALSEGCPTLTLVINGGKITWVDLRYSVEAGRPIVTLAGSGRTADKLAAVVRGEAVDAYAQSLIDRGQIQAIDMMQDAAQFTQTIEKMLSARSKS